jgi:hypothetical protein
MNSRDIPGTLHTTPGAAEPTASVDALAYSTGSARAMASALVRSRSICFSRSIFTTASYSPPPEVSGVTTVWSSRLASSSRVTFRPLVAVRTPDCGSSRSSSSSRGTQVCQVTAAQAFQSTLQKQLQQLSVNVHSMTHTPLIQQTCVSLKPPT